jgi:tmRNA-binding protein
MKKKKTKKLLLAKETVRKLEQATLREAAGAALSEFYYTACISYCKACVPP